MCLIKVDETRQVSTRLRDQNLWSHEMSIQAIHWRLYTISKFDCEDLRNNIFFKEVTY